MKGRKVSVIKGDDKVGEMDEGEIMEDFVDYGKEVRFYFKKIF